MMLCRHNAFGGAQSHGANSIIKRYANRKLYDTYDSRYVKLDELSAMLSEGIDFQIIDNETKEDITRVTLAQILVRNVKGPSVIR